MKKTPDTRRKFIKSLLALPCLSILPVNAESKIKTPSSTEGPFYPLASMRYPDIDSNLVKIEGKVKQAGGEILKLYGRVLDTNGSPIKDARVEIWQCDVNGHYLHTADTNSVPIDKGFQGFGYSVSDANGAYSFTTIKPVSYPGRTPHIHVKVISNGKELTSQFYINNHPENRNDFIYSRMPKAERNAVGMSLMKTKNGYESIVDIVV